MFIIWRGMGFVVVVFLLLAAMIVFGLDGMLGNPMAKNVANAAAQFLAAIGCGGLGWVLWQRGRETGEKHDLFFVPMVYYGPILMVIAIGSLLFGGKDEPKQKTTPTTVAQQPAKPKPAAKPTVATPAERFITAWEKLHGGSRDGLGFDDQGRLIAATFEPAAARDDELVQALRHFPELESVTFNGRVSDEAFATMRSLKGIRKLAYEGVPLSQSTLNTMSSLLQLTRLSIRGSGISDDEFRPLATLKNLEYLNLEETNVSHVGLQKFWIKETIKVLALKGSKVTAKRAHELAKHYAPDVVISGVRTESGYVYGKEHPQYKPYVPMLPEVLTSHPDWVPPTGVILDEETEEVTSLQYQGRADATDDMLKAIALAPSLRLLDLSGTPITDAGLSHLSRHAGLTTLHLSGTKITDAGLAHLRDLPELTELGLAGTNITDAQIIQLASIPKLQTLNLGGTGITDVALERLQRPAALRTLMVYQTAVSQAGVANFRVAQPLVRVHAQDIRGGTGSTTAQRPTTTGPRSDVPRPGGPSTGTPGSTTRPRPDPPKTNVPAPTETTPSPKPKPPVTPTTPATPTIDSDTRIALFKAGSTVRRLVITLNSHAARNRKAYPDTLDKLDSNLVRAEHKVDPWGDAILYFGAGKERDPFDRGKTLLLATAKSHGGQRVVAYINGQTETISEEDYQKLAK